LTFHATCECFHTTPSRTFISYPHYLAAISSDIFSPTSISLQYHWLHLFHLCGVSDTTSGKRSVHFLGFGRCRTAVYLWRCRPGPLVELETLGTVYSARCAYRHTSVPPAPLSTRASASVRALLLDAAGWYATRSLLPDTFVLSDPAQTVA